MTLEAVNTLQTDQTDTPANRRSISLSDLHRQEELLELVQSLTVSCAELRFRLAQVEARERIRDATRTPHDLGIDY